MIITDSQYTLLAATKYIAKGWAVLPVKPESKEPHFSLIKSGHLSATKELELVKFWLRMDPTINLGISAKASGLVIFDIDFRNGGSASAFNSYLDDPETSTNTRVVNTPGGYHIYYRVNNPDLIYRGELEPGIDIKYNGYVVAPPSEINGERYKVINDSPVRQLPKEIEERICRVRL